MIPASPLGCICELMFAGLTMAKKKEKKTSLPSSEEDGPQRQNCYTSRQCRTARAEKKTFFAVSALWIEGNLSRLSLCNAKTLPMLTQASTVSSSRLFCPLTSKPNTPNPPPSTYIPMPCCH
ncbi:hypothetical protein ILYODFUR_028644 [Ilyodon furcidens]|uniref:Uncharacterized protein n=1 Tax=Ilyodon furcidens TaxID=33524 RepID=A0ABV0TZK7_9TELE